MRLVFDTNVIISSLLSKGSAPFKSYEWAIDNDAVILICRETLAEFAKKIYLPKFDRYIRDDARREAIKLYRDRATVLHISPDHNVTASIDPDDNIFLALAKIGKADFVVSGDKRHLLSLGSFEGVPILSPADFLGRVAGEHSERIDKPTPA